MLEAVLNARLEAEVALVVVPGRKVIAKAGQQIVKLCRPYDEVFAQRNVDATADDEVKRVVAWRLADGCASWASAVDIRIEIAVRPAEESLHKWFDMGRPEFNDWPDVVGEQVAGSRKKSEGSIKVVCVTPITFKLPFDSDVLAEVKSCGAATTIQRECGNNVVVLGICMNIGIIARDFNFVIAVLGKYCRSKQQSDPEN